MADKDHYTAIVLAAGSGSRMGSDVPKQYLPLLRAPLLFYSLRAFSDSPVDDIVLVTSADWVEHCAKEIVEKYRLKKVRRIVCGGAERALSVYEGLRAAADADYVLIHDGARPLLTPEMVQTAMAAVKKEQACAFAVPVKDTIKLADADGYTKETPPRDSLWAMQTPQCFSRALLEEAYRLYAGSPREAVTDDAMLVETMLGRRVKLLMGSYENIKVTTPEDLSLAALFLRRRQDGMA